MTLDLDALRAFVKVAELQSFTAAAAQLGLGKAKVSLLVQRLEGDLGAKLLARSTRVVRLTGEGEQLIGRARLLLADADDVGAMFQGARSIRGRVRADFPVNLAREVIIPRLPELFARHPELELVLSATDRRVDAFREGFDCVLRVGATVDPNLVGKRLGVMPMTNCASPAYLRAHGVPQRLEDLDRHWLVHYSSTLGGERPTFEYPFEGGYREYPMRSLVTVNSVEAYRAAAIAGLGIVQVPRAGLHQPLAAGALVEVLVDLPCAPLAVSLLHTHGRSAPRRVRAVMSWVSEVMGPTLAPAADRAS